MKQFIDKIILFLLSVFAMQACLHGRYLIGVIYVVIAYAAICFWLAIPEDEENKFRKPLRVGIQCVAATATAFVPGAVTAAPVLLYDMVACKNYAAIGILAAANAFGIAKHGAELLPETLTGEEQALFYAYVALLCAFSILLAWRTTRHVALEEAYINLHDRDQVKQEKLREQTNEVLEAKDREVYTAQLAERNRIAREIHDNVGHMLTRGILQVGAMMTIHKDDAVAEELAMLRETLDTAMTNIRTSVHDLHDESVDLSFALEQMVKPLHERFKVHFEVNVDHAVPRNIKYAVIGIAKEAIANVIKHSENECVDVTFNEHPSMFQLVIHDYPEHETVKELAESKNAKKKKDDDTGIGLSNIEARVAGVGGYVNISREKGFRVFVTIPKPKEEA
ncbi:MAG: GHKL domain-containing protein [Lachnospiraceae bacterium]|nr:GHKL domain-containing protein [Lachnospiraceae bacterium]